MGMSTASPPVIGDNCAAGDNLLWQPGQTPRFINVELAYLVKCPLSPLEPPNAIFTLVQNPGVACHWDYEDDKFFIYVDMTQAQTEVGCVGRGVAAGSEFFFSQAAHGTSNFNNWQGVCGGAIAAINGTAFVDWNQTLTTAQYFTPEYLAWGLAWDQNWLPDQDAKHEFTDLGGDEYMVLLASHTIHSNCLFIYNHTWGDF